MGLLGFALIVYSLWFYVCVTVINIELCYWLVVYLLCLGLLIC